MSIFGDQHSLPGGLVHPGEDTATALARELREELGLDTAALPDPPRLRRVQDQLTTRPGRDGVFHRLHLVHVLRVPLTVRQDLASVEIDAEDRTEVAWTDVVRAAGLHLYPDVGQALATSSGPDADAAVLLPPMTDLTCRWR
ncbi:8-oxo-dGTP pyrophosphatase MutT (NUDIX family) [Kitasatospora gansuensis]|uniref:8-oxo-dGTP pyrophosphatase MutT (NUDIX family) n=1 Tax=Kitasatospora gansuensis TaxID=258050 RepID=A0A7W7WM94_9ACTN|nr:NUDIX domain-containing protein [Kitasatospora gansuensis]MBB4951900.1 8-oxo-dGTP pyrophosphatase MutT (NUDIX family) [Kitasatospora gansuensis]